MGDVAAEAKRWTDRVFGQFATARALVADRPGEPGNIHDLWEAADQEIRNMPEHDRRMVARTELIKFLSMPTQVIKMVRRHRAVPVFSEEPEPGNKEAEVAIEVIENLLDDEAILADLLDLYRCWPGSAGPLTNETWVQVFREPEPWRNQVVLWERAQTFVHEYLHLLD